MHVFTCRRCWDCSLFGMVCCLPLKFRVEHVKAETYGRVDAQASRPKKPPQVVVLSENITRGGAAMHVDYMYKTHKVPVPIVTLSNPRPTAYWAFSPCGNSPPPG